MIVLGKNPLSLAEFEQIVLHNEQISLDENALAKCNSNHEFLKKFSENKIIYGINTGFGPMAQYRIDCLLYTSPSPRDRTRYRMPSSA